MYCPNCGNTISKQDRFCRSCGANIKSGRKRKWCEQTFENTTFENVARWITENNGKIDIVRVNANMRFDQTGIFYKHNDWYVEYLKVSYYEGESKKCYVCRCAEDTDGNVHDGRSYVYNSIHKSPEPDKEIFTRIYSRHFPDGDNKQTHCGLLIGELQGDASNTTNLCSHDINQHPIAAGITTIVGIFVVFWVIVIFFIVLSGIL